MSVGTWRWRSQPTVAERRRSLISTPQTPEDLQRIYAGVEYLSVVCVLSETATQDELMLLSGESASADGYGTTPCFASSILSARSRISRVKTESVLPSHSTSTNPSGSSSRGATITDPLGMARNRARPSCADTDATNGELTR